MLDDVLADFSQLQKRVPQRYHLTRELGGYSRALARVAVEQMTWTDGGHFRFTA